jgi:hypothetical protein
MTLRATAASPAYDPRLSVAGAAPRILEFGGHRPPLQLLLALLFLLLAPAAALAQRTTLADALKAAVLRADETRIYAMLANDTAALDDMLTDDCLYVHSTGATQTKTEFLAALRTGAMKYTALRYLAPPQVRLYGAHRSRSPCPTAARRSRPCSSPPSMSCSTAAGSSPPTSPPTPPPHPERAFSTPSPR